MIALVGLFATVSPRLLAQVTVLPVWSSPTVSGAPSARYGAAMAYDAASGQIVLFGGSGSSYLNDTWTWNGTSWTQQSPATSPSVRFGAAMAYDAANGQIVLFGGNGSSGMLADTWTWDGTTWTQQSPASSPSARNSAAMAYDAANGQIVLFGGTGSSGSLADTWTWNGTTWTQQSPASSPSARFGAVMAYDAATGNTVLFGGNGSIGLSNDTWTWNGTTWTQQSLSTSPAVRNRAAVAYDAASGQIVLFGGVNFTGNLNDTWTWNGTTWTQQSPAASPSARYESAMAYDPATGNAVLFGGAGSSSSLADTWTLQMGTLNLGTANVCQTGATAPAPCSESGTVTFNVAAGTAIGSIKVLTQGTFSSDFQATSPDSSSTLCKAQTYVAATNCTVDVTFTPKYPGARSGAVVIEDNSSPSNVLATTYLSGTGTAPEVALTPGTISTVAGDGTSGYSGDAGSATAAELSGSNGVAVDSDGDIFIADAGNNVIREVAVTGSIYTVAGKNSIGGGDSGDGAAATSAALNDPNDVAVDGAGNLYIADEGNNAIREVNAATGIITTVAGGGSSEGDGGLATNAQVNSPQGVAVDSAGNLYIADTGDNTIREVNAATGIITTVAGDGTQGYSGDSDLATAAELNQPTAIAVDSAGDIFIADAGNNLIREVKAATGIITTVAGNYAAGAGYSGDGGAATSAELNNPTGVAVDSAGDLYIADGNNDVIREVNASTGVITTVAGNQPSGPDYFGDGGAATRALLYNPHAVALDGAGNIYIASGGNNVIREVNVATVSVSFATSTSEGSTDTTDGAQTTTVTNIGNASLTLTSNPSYPASFPENSSDTNLCSSATPVAAGATCDVSVNFTPAAEGTLSDSVTLTDNALNTLTSSVGSAQQSISLSGTATAEVAQQLAFGTAPAATLLTGGNAGSAITVEEETSNGTVVTTATDTISLTVAGPNNYSQTYTETAAAGVATFDLSGYALMAAGSYTYTATDTSLNLTTATANETVTAVTISSKNLGFSQNVGSSSSIQEVTVDITTTGTVSAIKVSAQGTSSLDFAVVRVHGGTCTTGAYTVGQSCYVNITFTPKYPGMRFGAVQLVNSRGTVLGQTLLSAVGTAPEVALTPGTISTVAGVFNPGTDPNWLNYSGDGGTATSAHLLAPHVVAVDSAGNLYIADSANNVIRKVDASTVIIATVAGDNSIGGNYSGDGSAATSAALNGPNGVTIDGAGNLYIADTGNSVIREVNASTGIITTVAGSQQSGSGYSGDGGAATSAQLNNPDGVAVDSAGNLYIADTGNNVIRKVNATTGIITTVAGNGTAGYSGDSGAATSAELNQPNAVAVDAAGNLYIADTNNNVIREVKASTGIITTVAGTYNSGNGGYSGDGGAATSAELNSPTGVALDSAGDLYIADNYNGVIREVSASTGDITTVAGNAPNGPGYGGDGGSATSTSALLQNPYSVALDGTGNLYIADGFNGVIRKVNVAAVPTVSFPTSTPAGSTDTTDGAETVAVSNIGNAALTFTSAPSYPANFPENTGDTNLCSSSAQVSAGANCDVSANFDPTGIGSNSGDITLTDNTLNATTSPADSQSISLSGTGTAPTAQQLAFGTAPAATLFTGGNAGSAITVDEETSGGSLVNTAADTITLTVTGPNSYSQTYTETAAAGVATFDLSGYALPAAGSYTYTATDASVTLPTVTANETVTATTTSSLNLGASQNVNSATSPQTVTVTIATAGTVSSIDVFTQGVAGLDFTQAASPNGGTCTTTAYSAGQSCTVNIIFTPKYPGLRFGVVQLVSSTGAVLGQTLLSATGTAPEVALTPGTISTVAGVFNPGTDSSWVNYSGDSGPATSAHLLAPNGVAVDSAGNLYIVGAANNVIRKVDASTGDISTVAGNNSVGGGYSGDGGAAASAALNAPNGVAVDGAGNLYIADSGNSAIREVNASTGIITTVAGNQQSGAGYSGNGAAATSAQLNNPGGVAVDGAGNLYIADTGNNVIREVNASTGIITTVAGNGTAGYSGDSSAATSAELNQPNAVTVDGAGNLYIADTNNNVIREVNASTGMITTVAGNFASGAGYSGDGGAATSAALNSPTGVTLDSAGDLYIADNANAVIRKVSASTGVITTVAGNQPNGPGYGGDGGSATSALLQNPHAVALDGAGNLYIADGFNGVIRKVNVTAAAASFATSTSAGSTDTTDGAETVAVSNIGNAALTFASNPSYPANFPENTGDTNLCSSGVQAPAGANCDVSANFAPASVGNTSGNVTLTDNTLNATTSPANTQSISLSGTATAAVAQQLAFNTAPAATLALAGNAGTVTVTEESENGATVSTASDTITLTVTGPNSYAETYTAAAVSGVASFSLSSVVLDQAGSYSYTVSIAGNASVTAATASETVAKGTLTITASSASMTYGGTAPAITGSVTSGALVGSDTLASIDITCSASSTAKVTSCSGSPANYTVTFVNGALTVNPAPLTITASSASMTYGGAVPTITASYSGFVNSDTSASLTTAPTCSASTATRITSCSGAVDANYTISYAAGALTVNPAAITVTASNASMTYGGTTPIITGSVTSGALVGSDTLAGIGITCATAATNTSAAGSYPTSCSGSPANYAVTYVGGTLTIQKAGQTVTFAAIADHLTTDGSFALSATASSGLTVGFAVVSGPATVSGSTLTLTGAAGTVVVSASQAGNGDYNAAATVTQSFAVTAAVVPAAVSLSTTSLVFGSEPTGETAAAQTVVLTAAGTQAVVVTNVTASTGFAASTACTTIAAGQSCAINVTFTPAATGAITGTLTIVDNASGSPQTVNLSGTGIAPGVTVAPTQLDFGSVALGETSTALGITIANSGTATLAVSGASTSGDYAVTNHCGSIPVGGSCSLAVTFTPAAAGTRVGTLTLSDNAGTQTVPLNGVGLAAGVSLTPGNLDFAPTLIGVASPARTLTLTNTGSAALTGIHIAAAGDFAASSGCGSSLAAGGQCAVAVTFSPRLSGTENGTLEISDSLGTQAVVLQGTGVAPGANLSATALTFGGEPAGTESSAQTVVLTNSGTSALAVASISTTTGFTETNSCPASLDAGASCGINVSFTPTASGAVSGTLSLSDNAGKQTVALTGQGTTPGLALSPSNATFGAEPVGTPGLAQTLELTNNGTAPVTITGLAASGDFTVVSGCPAALQPGQSCPLAVSFTPAATGSRTGALTAAGSGATGAVAVLNGTGTAPGMLATPAQVSFGSQIVGDTSEPQTVTIVNSGTAPLTVAQIMASGDFSEVNNCTSALAPGANCVVNVTMTATTAGTRTGTLQIYDNADGLHPVSLAGVGSQAGASLAPAALAFGGQPIPGSQISLAGAPQTVVLTNTGSAALAISGVTVSGEFTDTTTCGTSLAAGASCSVSVTFAPILLGQQTGAVTITDGAGAQTVALTGTGNPNGVALNPAVVHFGGITVGQTSTAQAVTLTNTSGQAIASLAISASGEFSETNNCAGGLAAGASCTLELTVTPALAGPLTGGLSILGTLAGSSADGAQVRQLRLIRPLATAPEASTLALVAMSASGGSAALSASPSALTFAGEPVGMASAAQPVTITNGGAVNLSSLAVSSTPDFPFTTTCGATLEAKATCTIAVSFDPTAGGQRTGTLNLTAAGGLSSPVALVGAPGSSANAGITPASVAFAAQGVHVASKLRTVTLSNGQNAPMAVTGVAITGVNAGDFAETNDCGNSLKANSACTASVTFTPSAVGQRTATLTFTDAAGTQAAALSGEGSDFTVSLGGSSPAAPGATASIPVTLTGLASDTQAVSLACVVSGVGTSCTATPGSVTLHGTAKQTATIEVNTGNSAMATPSTWPSGSTPLGAAAAFLWLLALGLAGAAVWQRRRWKLMLLAAALLAAAACGGRPTQRSQMVLSVKLTATSSTGVIHIATAEVTVNPQ